MDNRISDNRNEKIEQNEYLYNRNQMRSMYHGEEPWNHEQCFALPSHFQQVNLFHQNQLTKMIIPNHLQLGNTANYMQDTFIVNQHENQILTTFDLPFDQNQILSTVKQREISYIDRLPTSLLGVNQPPKKDMRIDSAMRFKRDVKLDEKLNTCQKYQQEENSQRVVVGIDIGTINFSVAVYLNGSLQVRKDLQGNHRSPLITCYSDTLNSCHPALNLEAKSLMEHHVPENEIYQTKCFVGRKFSDQEVQENSSNGLYNVKCDKNTDEEKICLYTSGEFCVTPTQIYTSIFSSIIDSIMQELGIMPRIQAVITVPASFNTKQREATVNAARSAGFNVLKLLNESTATFLRYNFNNSDYKPNDYFLVYDLGATLDITILRIGGNVIQTVASVRHNALGGDYFNKMLADYVVKLYKKKYDYNLKSDKKCVVKLENLCEQVKQNFSYLDQQIVKLNTISSNLKNIQITKTEFLNQIDGSLRKTISRVECLLNDNNISKNAIKKVIFCGGSTKITKVETHLIEYFGADKLGSFQNLEISVVEGAALQAAILSKHPEQLYSLTKFAEVVPLSIGIESHSNLMHNIIEKNTPIPFKAVIPFKTLRCNQNSCTFKIYEGEHLDCRKNRLLEVLVIDNLSKGPAGDCLIYFTMSIDESGILKVTAREQKLLVSNTVELEIPYTRGDRSDSEIQNILEKVRNNKNEEKKFAQFVRKKELLIDYCQRFLQEMYGWSQYEVEREYCSKLDLDLKNLEMSDEYKLEQFYANLTTTCENIAKKHNLKMPQLNFP